MFTNFIFQFDRQEFNIMYLRFNIYIYMQLGNRKATVRLKLLFELSNKHEKTEIVHAHPPLLYSFNFKVLVKLFAFQHY